MIKIVLVVILMTFILEHALRDEVAGKPANWDTTKQHRQTDSLETENDSYSSSAIFGEKMQPTFLLINK